MDQEVNIMLRILLVEDSPTQAAMICEILEEAGCEVEIAEDGQMALTKTYALLPDLLVLDVNLPIMDGFQVCYRLKRDPETAHIPVIILTERDESDDALTGLAAGAIDYIAKD